MQTLRALFLGLCFALAGTGCVTDRDYDRALEGCNGCELPEPRAGDQMLVYVIRPPTFFNAYQESDLYLASGGTEQYAGSLISNTYCPVRSTAGEIQLFSRTGKTVSLEVRLPVVKNGIGYVLLDFDGRWLQPKVSLTQITAEEGEALLGRVQGRCFTQPHAVRVRQRAPNP